MIAGEVYTDLLSKESSGTIYKGSVSYIWSLSNEFNINYMQCFV